MGRFVTINDVASLQAAPLAIGLFVAVSALLGLCAKHATRKFAKEKIAEELGEEAEEGLWQREILMGEKCQPFDFSGVIYYDGDGKRVAHLPPRSPRGRVVQSSSSFDVTTREKKSGK